MILADTEMSMNGWMDAMADTLKSPATLAKESAAAAASASSASAGSAGAAASSGGSAAAAGGGDGALTDQYSASFLQKAPEGNVTFVFTDVQNSTKLWEAAGPAMNSVRSKPHSTQQKEGKRLSRLSFCFVVGFGEARRTASNAAQTVQWL